MIDGRKSRHMTGVALYMRKRAADLGLNPDDMYVLGLLHDIGYLDGAKGHETRGRKLCEQLGLPEVLYYSIGHHSSDLQDMESLGVYIPKELILLMEADLSVTARGEICGFKGRLEDIKKRYGNCRVGARNAHFIREFYKAEGIRQPEEFSEQVFVSKEKGESSGRHHAKHEGS